jgi:sugar lactone lactonase YvrE
MNAINAIRHNRDQPITAVPRSLKTQIFAFALGIPILLAFASDAEGNMIYVAEFSTGQVDKITSSGVVSTLATGLTFPFSCIVGHDGNLYVGCNSATIGQATIQRVTPAGSVSTFATGLTGPTAITQDLVGNFYVTSESLDTVSKVSPSGTVTAFATVGGEPEGLAFDTSGNLFVSTLDDNIYKVDKNGVVSLFKNKVFGNFSPDASGLAIDSSNNLYLSNNFNFIDKITPSGQVSSYATGVGQALSLAFDSQGNLYAASGSTVTRTSQSGVVSTFASGFHHAQGLAVSVPEPSSAVLIGPGALGLAVVAMFRRTRRSAFSMSR